MKKLFIYLKNYRVQAALGPLFKLLEATLELFVPLVVAAVIDNGIAAGADGYGYIVKMCLLLVLLGVVGFGFSVTAQYFSARAAVGFIRELKHALFAHIGRFSYAQADAVGTSTLITRMTSDMNQVQSGLNLTLRLLLRSPFVVFGAMIMAFTIDLHAALIFAVAIPVLSAVIFGIMLWCIPLYRKVQARLDRVLGVTRENLTGVRVIRAFCREEAEVAAFGAENDRLTAMQKYVGRISALLNPVTYVIINLAIIVLIRTGALRVEAGLLTQGAVVALYNYMSQILVELIKFADLIINVTKSVACGRRIAAVLELPAGQEEAAPAGLPDGDGGVEFRNVCLRYRDAGDNSLTDISFSAARGETIGVIGGTGSGKSSLVNLIPRFYDATGGAVLIGGRDVQSIPLQALRGRIGVVPQRAVLFKGSLRDNMKWGNPDATDEMILAALEIAQARDILGAKDGGLDFAVEQGGKNLSGGQRQRLTIARALLKNPDILILDDSASALDFATDAALRAALRRLPGRPTVFIVSQRTSSISHADRILVLDNGRLVGQGSHEQLLTECETYREIYESQFKKEGQTNGSAS